jgi:hypothetical protein
MKRIDFNVAFEFVSRAFHLRRALLFSLVLLIGAVGCRTVRPLPQFDLSEPGWIIRNGQAIWHVSQGETEVAGEVIVATGTNGRSFVQFSKVPFPLVIARASSRQWEVEFPPQNKHYSGRGAPPLRLIWLWLPRVLSGEPPPKTWSWRNDDSGWRLENLSNGEFIEGYFAQ